MALIINHNMTAQLAARNLSTTYDRLSTSVQRLSSGLRINSAADDAAGLAVREMMRADITTMNQGIRNTADAISMIQTADGALSIIDEKLVRMKELAEQAATGTYTDAQREIINSEYQAMAAEIDRIANATNFNGIKLLDGSVTNSHGGQGIKIHFGVSNKASEDYYFINIQDSRATSSTGLRIGGDAKNDIWGQGAAGSGPLAGPGCCTAGYSSLNNEAGFVSGETFTYGYNWNWEEDSDPKLLTGRYIAGRYTVNSSDSLQDLVNKVNAGSQSRVGVQLDADGVQRAVEQGGTLAVCLGDEAYVFGDAEAAGGLFNVDGNEGPVYNYKATGTYDGGGFVFNDSFGLTAAQLDRLQAAGVDLSSLGLEGATVTATGESTEGPEQARNSLSRRLSQAFNALGLSERQSLVVDGGVTSGFVVDDANLLASASSAVVSGLGLQATIVSGQTLRVHTGVYADKNGNWTDNAEVASALGLQEVVFNYFNNGTEVATATLINGDTFVSPEYAVSSDGELSITATDAANLSLAGLHISNYGFASATVTGDFRGTATTAASAEAELLGQIQEAWKAKWSNVENRVKVSAGTTAIPAAAFYDSADIKLQNDLTPTAVINSTSRTISAGTLNINTGIWIQSGTGVWTSSKAVADAFNEIGANFKEMTYSFTNDVAWNELQVTRNGVAVMGGTLYPLSKATTNITTIASLVAADVISSITSQPAEARVWFAPDGSNSMFPPTSAQLTTANMKLDTGIPDNLTVTADFAGETVEIATGTASLMPRDTKLGTLINATGKALSNILKDAQQSAATLGLTGMGRITARQATPPAGTVPISEVKNLQESKTFVSGVLDKSVATGSYSFSGYSFSASLGIGLNSAQMRAFARAGVDLSKLHLVKPTVSASASSTVSSASARQALVDRLNQAWNSIDFDSLSSLTVVAGSTTGYSALTGINIVETVPKGEGKLSGSTGAATINEGESIVVHTGVYADEYGNWTDDSDIASIFGLKEVTYEVENNRKTWVAASANFRSTDRVYSGYVISSAAFNLLSASGASIPAAILANFSAAQVRVFASAHTSAEVDALLYSSGVQAFASAFGGPYRSIEVNLSDNGSTISLNYENMLQSASAYNATGDGAFDRVRSGKTVVFHTGIYVNAYGAWTEDSALGALLGFNEIRYSVGNNSVNTEYTITMVGGSTSITNPQPVQTLQELADLFSGDIRQWIDVSQTAAAAATPSRDTGHIYVASTNAAPIPPTAATFDATLTAANRDDRDNGIANLDITFNIDGKNMSSVRYGPPALTAVSAGTNMDQLATAVNGHFSQVLSALQLNGSTDGYGGAGRIVNALNTPPVKVIAMTDVKDLKVDDIYKAATPDSVVNKQGIIDSTRQVTIVASAGTASANAQGISNFGAWALASAINNNADSQFWAMVQSVNSLGKAADMVYVFAKEGGNLNSLLACDVAGSDLASREGLSSIQFENAETAKTNQSGTSFSLGGEKWATMKPTQTKANLGTEVWNVTLEGRDVGSQRDLWIANAKEVTTPALGAGIINGMNRDSFVEIQNAANGSWAGAHVRTQSTAQEALDALTESINCKDKIRADLGALQNRLENTMSNLTIQAENLQAAESRISDVDVATEMTQFTRNNVLAQAATSMLAQANSLSQLALSLIG